MAEAEAMVRRRLATGLRASLKMANFLTLEDLPRRLFKGYLNSYWGELA
jgi:hypothetical protein